MANIFTYNLNATLFDHKKKSYHNIRKWLIKYVIIFYLAPLQILPLPPYHTNSCFAPLHFIL